MTCSARCRVSRSRRLTYAARDGRTYPIEDPTSDAECGPCREGRHADCEAREGDCTNVCHPVFGTQRSRARRTIAEWPRYKRDSIIRDGAITRKSGVLRATHAAVVRAAQATNWRDRIAALNDAIAASGEPDATKP